MLLSAVLTQLSPAGGAGRGIPARRAGASPVTSALGAEDAGVPAARTLRGGVVAGGETRRQDPDRVNALSSQCDR